MRHSNNSTFNRNGLFSLKDKNWLDKQRIAGRIAAEALVQLEDYVKGNTFHSMATHVDLIEKFILKEGGEPTFKGYKGFPAAVCVSINKQLVHGIPDDTVLDHGDVVSFDLGVTYQGAIADTALTCIMDGKPNATHEKLVKATEECLMKGIEAIQVGNRLGCIGHAISKCAKGYGFGLINNYGGHGLDWNVPHAPPFIANKADLNEGIRIQPGLVIAIEPMLVIGSTTTRVAADGWTVMVDDVSAHFEHSIFVHEDHVEIITDRSKL